jgi:hypothetical protein
LIVGIVLFVKIVWIAGIVLIVGFVKMVRVVGFSVPTLQTN